MKETYSKQRLWREKSHARGEREGGGVKKEEEGGGKRGRRKMGKEKRRKGEEEERGRGGSKEREREKKGGGEEGRRGSVHWMPIYIGCLSNSVFSLLPSSFPTQILGIFKEISQHLLPYSL